MPHPSPATPASLAPSPTQPTSRSQPLIRFVLTVAIALGIGWLCGAAMRADARLAEPPGLFRGMLHGALMPVAWPTLLAGQEQDIYSTRNTGRTYKLGYSMGVNLSGLIFFGWLFFTIGSVRGLLQRKKPQ